MSELKTIEQLTFKSGGISALADRPNQPSTFGMGGLSASELKAKFDELATEVKDKINEVISALSGETATQYIPVPYDSAWGESYKSVYDVIKAVSSSNEEEQLAKKMLVNTNMGSHSLITTLNDLIRIASENKEGVESALKEIESIQKDYDGLAKKSEIPTKTSQLYNDGDGNGLSYATMLDAYDQAEQYAKDKYLCTPLDAYRQANVYAQTEGLAKKDEIPTKVSQLENDANYAKKSDISKIFKPCGSVQSYEELPISPDVGDTYNVIEEAVVNGKTYPAGTNFAWSYDSTYDGYFWDALGGTIDLSNYALKSEMPTKTSDLVNNGSGALPFITAQEAYLEAQEYAKRYNLVSQENLPTKVSQLENDSNFVTEDKLPAKEVTRISLLAIYENGDNADSFAAKLNKAIKDAIDNRPVGAQRTNIEFYDTGFVSSLFSFWGFVDWQSNCNYSFDGLDEGYLDITMMGDLENCDFYGFSLNSQSNFGLALFNCKNIQIINCKFAKQPLYIQSGCTDIYVENCVFETTETASIDIQDTSDNTFHWVMIENCVFAKSQNAQIKAIDASGVTNTKSLITISNCHFDDLSKVSESGVAKGLGKITILASENDLPTRTSQLINDGDGDGLEFANSYDVYLQIEQYAQNEGLAKKSDISTVYRYKGSVNYYAELPTEGNEIGDTYNVANAYGVYQGGTNFSWDGKTWDALGGALDLSVFVKKTDYATPTTNGVMLASDKAKLDSVEAYANNYTLPKADGAVLGGVIVGDNLSIDGNGILKGNYPVATPTKAGLMGANDKFVANWMYENCGKSYHTYGECGWKKNDEWPNPINASITYVRTGYKRGLITFAYILTDKNGADGVMDMWHISIAKVNTLLTPFDVKIKAPAEEYYGGSWVRQNETVQGTPHVKSRMCIVTPYCFLPGYYASDGSGGATAGSNGTKNFIQNELVQLMNIPVEEE